MIENLYTPDCIRTFTGLYFNVVNPTLEMICIEDIAHSLSMQPRFGGHLRFKYTVACHSLAVCGKLSKELKLTGLLHDASEAYLMDFPTPVKKHFPQYYMMEDKIMRLIAEKFKIKYPLPAEVKAADKRQLELEWDRLMIRGFNWITFIPKTQDEAKTAFLEKFTKLTV